MSPIHTYYSPAVERAEKLDRTWRESAACRGHDSALFFPAGSGSTPPDYGPALAICAGCPVLDPCRQWAETAGDIQGGYTVHGHVVGGCAPKQSPMARLQSHNGRTR